MSKAEELAKLHELKKQGILSEEEFNAEKAKLLAADSGTPAAVAAPVMQSMAPAGGHGHIQRAANFASSNLVRLSCAKCKGEVQFLPGLDVVRCTFCGHESAAGKRDASAVQVPNLIVPFKVTQMDAKQRFYNHLANDDFVPDSIFDDATSINVYGLFCPGYFFDGKYEGNWTALSIVKYEVKRGSEKVGEKEEATPISGTVRGLFKQVVIASKFADDASVDAAELRSRIQQYAPEYVQGFVVESLSTAKSQEACEVIARKQAHDLATVEAIGMMPTSSYKNLAVNIDVSADVSAFLQSLWVCVIKHGGTDYRMWLPGDQPGGTMSGTIPQDEQRIQKRDTLESAGKNWLIGAFLVYSGISIGLGSMLSNDKISIESDLGKVVVCLVPGLFACAPFAIKGWKKLKAGQAELAATLEKSKQHRRDRMPKI